MRVLHRLGPRRVALLVMPVLLAAGALQGEPKLPTAPAAAVLQPLRMQGSWLMAAETTMPAAPVVGAPAPRARLVRPGTAASRGSRRAAAPTVQDRGAAALAALRYDWRSLGYRVVFRPYDGRGLGSANRRTRTIVVYVTSRQSELSLRASIAHELGHALDFEYGTEQRRGSYRRIRGLSASSPWFPCDRCSDFASPAGDFAEVFAAWLVGPGDFRGRLKGPPTARELRELARLFRVPARTTASAGTRATPRPTPSPEDDDEPVEGNLPDLLAPSPSPSPER